MNLSNDRNIFEPNKPISMVALGNDEIKYLGKKDLKNPVVVISIAEK